MGIKGLRKLLKTKAPSSVNLVSLSKYTGKSLAIDCSSYMYQFRYNAARKGKGSHLRSFYEMIVALLQHNITPVFVFDGKPPKEKDGELKKRKDVFVKRTSDITDIKTQINEILNGRTMYDDSITQSEASEIIKFQKELTNKTKNQINVSKEHFLDATELFSYAGIPCLKSTGEADFLCVKLCKDGITSGVLSEDMDILTHGAEYLITGINDNSFRKEGKVIEYSLSKALSELNISMEQFVDICILCKCDYATKINGVAGITAINLIKSYGNIDALIDKINEGGLKYSVQDGFNYVRARELFHSSETMKYEANKANRVKANETLLLKFLLDNTNYGKSTLMNKLEICRNCRINNSSGNIINAHNQVQVQEVPKRKIVIKKRTPTST